MDNFQRSALAESIHKENYQNTSWTQANGTENSLITFSKKHILCKNNQEKLLNKWFVAFNNQEQ